MTIGTPDYSIKNLNEKTDAEIEDLIKKSKEELFNLRFQKATSQLENNSRIKAVKADVSRMYTVLRERELGITTAPEETSGKAEK
ncbi:ribosomal protein L29 [Parascardovia denticolens DSM 10105 = JCM 12538]|uniref:Large ribosomal subunit protein uL29 n=1 Tax=Parascardovia denticolens DSM 10105 = JCM 12538 TaxID=864564 RepID=E6K003_PARDN|nr:50S ribosomal protein L29 [Parascardovia denticolens]EFG32886.1 ribosomal protein L29 [Parascardovia denticolens F0305]EFT83245.1 ribosomal protein L29 [Parascardovia denticolens DSM 10105 = JCM 12538]BAR05854.1 50S ribosomal protein L29 [Parascardovia denticolens DSM 10105 = JCM 12538]